MQYTDYQKIIEDFFLHIEKIVMDKDHWVWMDYRRKIAYWGRRQSNAGPHVVPANIVEYYQFMKYFKSHGITECWFRELKQYVDFDGRSYEGRQYYCVFPLDEFRFQKVLNCQSKIRNCFEVVNNNQSGVGMRKNKPSSADIQNAITLQSMADFFSQFAKFLKNDSKNDF